MRYGISKRIIKANNLQLLLTAGIGSDHADVQWVELTNYLYEKLHTIPGVRIYEPGISLCCGNLLDACILITCSNLIYQVHLYDMPAQRRPVMSFNFRETPIKPATKDLDVNTIYIGNGSGDLASVDIRTDQLIDRLRCKGVTKQIVGVIPKGLALRVVLMDLHSKDESGKGFKREVN
ncbi:WD repeat-containing protein 74-like protein [Tanacetum coccineum]|uniref:WD repeat-containing protein 74-like protein n=1 Tax=Tanacetum coccineum TaxID=301880 RepID=A0ABQ5I2R6_9ASTR